MSAIRCSRCNRALSAITVVQGTSALGPSCARILGITPPKPVRPAPAIPRTRRTRANTAQLDLVLEVTR